jgi:photosystem II stability/assembly factor-like uncharacterized protein
MANHAARLLWGLCLSLICCAATHGADVHHYVFFNRDRERISDPGFLTTAAFAGAQIKYTWRELEQEEGVYDFSAIQHDLAFLNLKGKKLFIQLQDASFDPGVVDVPRYLLIDARYNGGADKQYNVPDDDEARAVPEGWVARRWDPAVQERFRQLLLALGKEFDGKVEGINLPETAVEFGESGRLFPKGFTPAAYRDAVITNMIALKRAFAKSVTMQYANFMPGEWLPGNDQSYLRSVYQRAKELKVVVGGPDLLPYKPGQMSHCYPLIKECAGKVPTGIAVQEGNYQHENPKTGLPVTISELVEFATEQLKVDYIFWCTQEPFYSQKLIPFLQAQPRVHAIFRSTDGGQSWSRSDAGLPGNSRINALISFGESVFAGTDSGIFISGDEGRSWGPSSGMATNAGRITSFTSLGQTLFAGTDQTGILASLDSGRTWKLIRHDFGPQKVRCLFCREGIVYAGTDTDGVLASGDSGKSWTRLDRGLPGGAQIFAMSSAQGRLFAALYSQGLYWWNDREQSWVKAGSVSPLALASIGDSLIAGHNPGGIYWSDDAGKTWSQAVGRLAIEISLLSVEEVMGLPTDAPIWELAGDDELVFAGAANGIYYSEDRGRNWKRARVGLPSASPGVSFLLKKNFVLAGTLIERANGGPGGAANWSRPVDSELNRPSPANGSRR